MENLKRTPLYSVYSEYGGKIVDFAGWEMPIQFEGIIVEHEAVRNAAGLFDVSHMGEVMAKGPGAFEFVQNLVTNDIAVLQENQILYTFMCYTNGGVVDDLLVYKFSSKHYCLVINAGNIEKDFQWMLDNKGLYNVVHEAGGLVYYDGANLNAIKGIARPGDMGFDVVHMNLHKTFSTSHGGGGPGSGPVGVKKEFIPYLPVPVVERKEEDYILNYDKPLSIGNVKSFYGNFGILVRAYTYILSMGAEGLKKASEMAVLNANYMKSKLKDYYNLPIDKICKHEFVLAGLGEGISEVTTLDVAKRLLDYGYHPPTIYFPLIVHDAIMIEPTETESLETMDAFIDAMISIAKEAKENPQLLKLSPYTTHVRRLDEVKAARNPVLKYTKTN